MRPRRRGYLLGPGTDFSGNVGTGLATAPAIGNASDPEIICFK